MLKKILRKIDERFSLYAMAKIIGVLIILFLLMQTQRIWGNWMSIAYSVLQPFLYGFALAYIMNPLVLYMKAKGLNKNFSILLLWIIILVILVILIVLLLPMLYAKINEFISSLIQGVQWISFKIKEIGNLKDFSLVNSLTDNIIKFLEAYDDWMPGLVSSLPSWMSTILDYVTNILFTIIIAIYMLFDFDRMKGYVKKAFHLFIPNSDIYLHEIDENVTVYLKSMALLILIRFVEYCAFYYCVGHHDWLIIGIISALGAVIPYIGGTVANAIGILTGLTLPSSNLAALIIGIIVLSNVDNYVISPIVHEKRSALGPLITLFAVFAGGVIGNVVGIMVSVPLVIAIKTTSELYQQRHEHSTFNQAMKTEIDDTPST